MRDFHELNLADLKEWLETSGEPAFRAKQIFEWVYGRGVVDWQSMSDLGKTLREALTAEFHLRVLQEKSMRATASGDITCVTWGLRDGKAVDSVVNLARKEVVLSTQVGCPVRCTFCASGKQGGVRNLRAAEMVQQVLMLTHKMQTTHGQKISQVTLAGMGEPFKNTDHVLRAIQELSSKETLGIPQNKICISTVGIPEGIVQLAQQQLMVRLIIGLHAPNQALRTRLIPLAKQYPLDAILSAAESYWHQIHLPITFDYVMLEDINDHPDQARELAHLLKRLSCTVRIIPYNHVDGFRWMPSSKKAIKQFRTVLFGSNIDNIIYEDPACELGAGLGQLEVERK